MRDAAEIYLWGTRIGAVWQPDDHACVSFEYDHDFLRSGVELSPLHVPLADTIYKFPHLLRSDSFLGLPGLLANSLPDKYGNAVVRRWLMRQGKSLDELTPVERLCLVGKRGMGALEFVPAAPPFYGGGIDLDEMAEVASGILSGEGNGRDGDHDDGLSRMMEIGSVAGGARAKAVVAWNEKTGEIRCPQDDLGEGFRHWLVKFDGVEGNGDRGVLDKKQFTRIEYAYYLMARDAGIEMQECKLLEKDGRCHFMTLRYDREGGGKLHALTLAALGHFDYNDLRSCSYEQYAMIAAKLHPSLQEKKQLFRRTAFNFVAVNCDDHVKNFSFMMDRSGAWKMTPAYDVTFAFVPGHQWLGAHQMTLNGKASGITRQDLMEFGRKTGLSEAYCRKALEDVVKVVERWMTYAQDCGIAEERAREIADVIDLNGLVKVSME